MADVMKLEEVGIIDITFDPAPGYSKADDMNVLHTRSNDGTLYSYKIYHKRRWEVPLTQFNKTKATQINSWWQSLTQLRFYPDLIYDASTYFNARITNTERPLLGMTKYTFEILYEGSVTIMEI